MITHLIDPERIAAASVEIEGEGYRHLFRARRLALGDRLRAVDGRGRARWAEVAAVDRRRATLALGAEAPANEAPYQLKLVVAPLRLERGAWLVEKATELGVSAIAFVRTARTPRDYGEGRLDRLRRVAAAALVQCHRSRLPAITGVHPWDDLERLVVGSADRWFLDPEAAADDRLRPAGIAGAVLIGPEGGWDPAEQKALARLAAPAGLGPRILRVETAALAAAARLLS